MTEVQETKTIIVQNADRDAHHKDYLQFKDQLLVHGVFATLQGEGPYTGMPSVFVRLAGCNYGSKTSFCQFCDTDFSFYKGKPLGYTALVMQIHAQIIDHASSDTNLIVITGGEPTIQFNLALFVFNLILDKWTVQIETNGTHLFPFVSSLLTLATSQIIREKIEDNLYIVISPKAGSKGYGQLLRDYQLASLKNIRKCLKFVIDSNPDSMHHHIPGWADSWRRDQNVPIYISPMAIYKRPYHGEVANAWDSTLIDQEATQKNYNYAAQFCLKSGYRLSIQQHLFCAIP